MANGIANAARGVRYTATARTSPTRPRTTLWVLGDPVKSFLAGTGRHDGGWVCRQFHMAEDLSDHLPLGHRSNEPQRPLMAKRAGSHIQSTHPLEQPRPAPVRRGAAGLRLFHALLAWRWRAAKTH